jgi:putative methanogenesis marker protein 12
MSNTTFVGIDHGTVGIRFAGLDDGARRAIAVFELSRKKAAEMSDEKIIRAVEVGLDTKVEEIKLVALTYSMGDKISIIKNIKRVKNRGVKSEKGAGVRIGGGTKVFDALKNAALPAILIPGIHAGSEKIDPRMKFFSHCASPEKVGVAYHIYKKGFVNFIFSDISSNTVTMAAAKGLIIGAIDACIFAPGLYQGPIDLQLLRLIEEGVLSANEAFSNAGLLRKRWLKESNEELVSDTLSLFAAMEISAMRVLMRDYDASNCNVFLTGSEGEKEGVKKRINRLLGSKCETLTRYSAAIGCAEIAKDVFYGEKSILGIEVEKEII